MNDHGCEHTCSLSLSDKSLEVDLTGQAARASSSSLGQDQHVVS